MLGKGWSKVSVKKSENKNIRLVASKVHTLLAWPGTEGPTFVGWGNTHSYTHLHSNRGCIYHLHVFYSRYQLPAIKDIGSSRFHFFNCLCERRETNNDVHSLPRVP